VIRRRAAAATALAAIAALAVGLAGYALSTPPSGTDDAARAGAQAAETPGGGAESPPADNAPSDSAAGATAAPTPDGTKAGAKEDAGKGGKDTGKDAAKESDAGPSTGSPDAPAAAPDARLAEAEQPVADPVAFGKKAAAGSFEVSLSKLEAIEGKAEGIGEVAGPAIRFVVTVRNTTDADLRLDTAVVTADYGKDAVPATELSQSGAKGFPATVAAGKEASGTFVFQIPTKERGSVRILVNQSASEQVVAFEGAAPTRKG
jgi:hypothetical protein